MRNIKILYTKYFNLFWGLLLALIIIIFYKNLYYTWFQQDEWDWIGRYIYYNGRGPFPFVEAFKSSLFPHPRYRFTPFFDALFAIQVYFFKLKFFPYVTVSLFFQFINSLLVYFLAKKITENKKIAALTSLFFATSSIGQKATTWVFTSSNTHTAAIFSFLALIYFWNYLKKNKNKDLIKAFVAISVALWFKETAVSMLAAFVPISYIYRKKLKFTFWLTIRIVIYFALYLALRFLLSRIGLRIHTEGYPDFGRFLTINEYLSVVIWGPIRSLVDVFVPEHALLALSRFFSKRLIYSAQNLQGTAYDIFVETTGLMFIHFVLFVLFSVFGALFYKRLKRKEKFIILIALLLIFASTITSFLLIIRGKSALVRITRSRDLYLSVSGASLLLALLTYKLKLKYLGIFLGIYFIFHYSILNTKILAYEITKANQRIPIIEKIYSTYPKLNKKTIFYTESDTPYYGSLEPSVPYQTGFGRTILVWYIMKSHSFSTEFVKDDYLFMAHEQGYEEIGDEGFGYFSDKDKLLETMKKHNLTADSVYAFSYSGVNNNITDITDDFRKEISP